MDWRHIGPLERTGATAYGALLSICVWNKSNAGMGSLYRTKLEFVFVFNHCAPLRNAVDLNDVHLVPVVLQFLGEDARQRGPDMLAKFGADGVDGDDTVEVNTEP